MSMIPGSSRHATSAAVVFIALFALAEFARWHFSDISWRTSDSPLFWVVSGIIKFAVALVLFIAHRSGLLTSFIPSSLTPNDNTSHEGLDGDERIALRSRSPSPSPGHGDAEGEWGAPVKAVELMDAKLGRSTVLVFLAASLYPLNAYTVHRTGLAADRLALYVVIPAASLCALMLLRGVFSRPHAATSWQSALLQFSGIFIARSGVLLNSKPPSYFSLFATTLSTAFTWTLTDLIYKVHYPANIPAINTLIFAFGLGIHLIIAVLQWMFASPWTTYHTHISLELVIFASLAALRDVASLFVILYHDATTLGILSALSASAMILLGLLTAPANLVTVFIGSGLSLLAAGMYIVGYSRSSEREKGGDANIMLRRILPFGLVSFVISTLLLTGSYHKVISEFGNDMNGSPLLDSASCARRPLRFAPDPNVPREYHKFDNVLLVVFFSHPRYDVNLDFYHEVYSDYFPNILYIGPASREDKGFDHSYDVFVDSYESDEDLSDPTYYKMAGRMAHHMLHTALQEHPCYDGYLWAPFDTLLNVPRLEQFDQSRFWYHSPWGRPVPNPALDDEGQLNLETHAPPANAQPNSTEILVANWTGWQKDWWWGDPHVGLEPCTSAYDTIRGEYKDRLAAFTGHARDGADTRFVGGSADTLYVPGARRAAFMEVLGAFLATDCFLEIATPTALHMAVPYNEAVLFVDHWWIWEPPLNATFVRQRWEAGFEVDTFHTFHWGDKNADGVWQGNPAHIPDVRQLLRESAERQKIEFPVRES